MKFFGFHHINSGYLAGVLPLGGGTALASAVLAVPTIRGAVRHADDIPKLVPYLARNVAITIITPALLAISLFVSR